MILDAQTDTAPAVEVSGGWLDVNCNRKTCTNDNAQHDGLLRHSDKNGDRWAVFRPTLPFAGRWRVAMSYSTSSTRATNVPVEITSAAGTSTILVDQNNDKPAADGFRDLGVFDLAQSGHQVLVTNNVGNGKVIIDAFRFTCEP